MNVRTLIEEGKIRQIPEAQNVAFLLNEAHLFIHSEYKFMKGREQHVLLNCLKTTCNGKVKLVYFTEGMQTLTVGSRHMNFTAFIEVIENIFSAMEAIEKNGFLKPENLDDSFEGIYVDSRTRNVKLLYFPIQNTAEDRSEHLMEFRNMLAVRIKEAPRFSDFDVQPVCDILEKESLDYAGIRQQLQAIRLSGKDVPQVYEESIVADGTKQTHANLRLISKEETFAQNFHIQKAEYIIGKSPEKADGIIPRNTVSRIHCAIRYISDKYYVEDLNSTNGTKLNQEKIPGRQPVQLHNGDLLSIAGIEFLVEL